MNGAGPRRPGFADHFSRDSASYAEYRPRYPAELFGWLASLVSTRRVVWDVATGSGQAATMLARHFQRVFASDASVAQLRARTPAPGVHYVAERAESSALGAQRADLVTVAQAYHWLDHPRFHAEVERILAPGGVLAIWCYGSLAVGPELEQTFTRFYDGTVGPFWPPERAHIERGYRHFQIPIDEVTAPPMRIDTELTLPQLLGYVRTWSAVGRYIKVNGRDPVPAFGEELGALWGDPSSPRKMSWPMSVRAGRWLGAAGGAP